MAYNTVPIKKDVDGIPIPQHYNIITGQYEPSTGIYGAQKVLLCDTEGSPMSIDRINSSVSEGILKIENKLDELIEVVNNVS